MTHLQAAVLGVVQGITEFLPVSSSGHLILAPRLLGWSDQGLGFDAVIHLGTLAALLVYFRADLWRMARGMDRRLALLLVAATLPAGLAGLLLEKAISSRLRDPLVIAATMIGWALVMWVADRQAAGRLNAVKSPADVGWGAGLAVGLAQTLALVPGTSRSGVTITAGLFAGLSRPTAARFAFLLGIPITAAAGGLKTLSFLRHGADPAVLAPLATGLVASFVAGLAAVWFLVNFLETRSLTPFVIYRCALGIVIVILFAA
ncbi:MAG TPA: undecaprenyl-diphosphate phosphatase [Candidatus Limnocylindrales bacterium]|nr:undecaprenyl-diphosphate phosphatase [Candidatus Limnocylindrales bacterium]